MIQGWNKCAGVTWESRKKSRAPPRPQRSVFLLHRQVRTLLSGAKKQTSICSRGYRIDRLPTTGCITRSSVHSEKHQNDRKLTKICENHNNR
eukprot:scaffold83948_cov63-Attheya_sp.AAC.1